MKKILFFISIIIICFNCSAQHNSKIKKNILSKNYNLKFSINRTILNVPNKSDSEIIDGSILRKNGHIYSESNLFKGIYEDTLGIIIDDNFKMVNLFNNFSKSTILINPFYDPAEIINYSILHSNLKRTEMKNGNIVYDYFFSDSFPIKKIQIVENKKTKSFIIDIIGHRLNEEVRDIINYKILADTFLRNAPKVSDYVEFKVDRYVRKPILSEYDFFNGTALEALFKEIETKKMIQSNPKN